MGFFDKLVSVANNEFASKVSEGLNSDASGFIDTGSYSFNALLSGSIYGGLPDNRVTALAGEEATGKTFFTLSMVHSFLQMNPKGAVMYFESEGALSSKNIESQGIDKARMFVMPVVTIEDFRTQAARILDEYIATDPEDREPMLMVLDSLGSTSTNKETTDISTGKNTRDMTRAQLIRGTFRALSLKLNIAKVPLLITNHVYAEIGGYFPTQIMGGGGGLRYAASSIIFLTKSKFKEGEKQTGVELRAKAVKSRFTIEQSTVTTLLDFNKGLQRYHGLLEIGEIGGVLKHVDKKWVFPNGKSALEKQINHNPEQWFTKEVLDQLDEGIKKKFMYSGDILSDHVEEDIENNVP